MSYFLKYCELRTLLYNPLPSVNQKNQVAVSIEIHSLNYGDDCGADVTTASDSVIVSLF